VNCGIWPLVTELKRRHPDMCANIEYGSHLEMRKSGANIGREVVTDANDPLSACIADSAASRMPQRLNDGHHHALPHLHITTNLS
jgi:hypothetical protein